MSNGGAQVVKKKPEDEIRKLSSEAKKHIDLSSVVPVKKLEIAQVGRTSTAVNDELLRGVMTSLGAEQQKLRGLYGLV